MTSSSGNSSFNFSRNASVAGISAFDGLHAESPQLRSSSHGKGEHSELRYPTTSTVTDFTGSYGSKKEISHAGLDRLGHE